jgi:hypothetical protein
VAPAFSPYGTGGSSADGRPLVSEVVDALVDSQPPSEHLIPPPPRAFTKKEAWLAAKRTRRDVHVEERELARNAPRPRKAKGKTKGASETALATTRSAIGSTVKPVTTLYNLWTREALPIVPGESVEDRFHPFLRDHFTNQATRMDVRLIDVLTQVARKFRAARIEVVSGYRSPKYNLMLRKKGREVARASQHTEGHAVDFRVRGVPTTQLLRYVRSLRRGGVGYYPRSQFVHSDTGRIRFWRGS